MTKIEAFEFFEIVGDNNLAAEIIFGPQQATTYPQKDNTKRDSKTRKFKTKKIEAGPLSRLRRYVGPGNRAFDRYYSLHQDKRLEACVKFNPFVKDVVYV